LYEQLVSQKRGEGVESRCDKGSAAICCQGSDVAWLLDVLGQAGTILSTKERNIDGKQETGRKNEMNGALGIHLYSSA
jgi:hypothetical protein